MGASKASILYIYIYIDYTQLILIVSQKKKNLIPIYI